MNAKRFCPDANFKLSLTLAFGMAIANSDGGIIPADQSVNGRSYPEWNAEWWKWVLSIPSGINPLRDTTGVNALRNQTGTTWFLGFFLGPGNTASTITRNISIPNDKFLFVSVCGSECSTIEPPPWGGETEEELTTCAQSDVYSNLFFSVDGVEVGAVEDFRTTSKIFDFTVPVDNIMGVAAGPGKSVGSGINLMVEPLAVGPHTIRFRASYAAYNVSWDITYKINVYARPVLTARRLPDAILELSWPVTTGFSLQGSDNLSGSTWTSPTFISSSIANGVQTVTISSQGAERYFRLRKP